MCTTFVMLSPTDVPHPFFLRATCGIWFAKCESVSDKFLRKNLQVLGSKSLKTGLFVKNRMC
jgi:hypothetical protein